MKKNLISTLRVFLLVVGRFKNSALSSSLNLIAPVGNSCISLVMGVLVIGYSLADILVLSAVAATVLAGCVFGVLTLLKRKPNGQKTLFPTK